MPYGLVDTRAHLSWGQCQGRTIEPFEHILDIRQLVITALSGIFCEVLHEFPIVAARKLAQFDSGARVPATTYAITDSIRWADRITEEIDERWPTRSTG